MRIRLWVILPLLVGAFGAGWLTRAKRAEVESGREAPQEQRPLDRSGVALGVAAGALSACQQRAGLDPGDRTALVNAVTDSVRALLSEARSAGAAPTTTDATPRPVAGAGPDSVEAATARRAADAIVERAVSAEAWTDEDKTALRPLRSRMAVADRQEISLALARAINEGRLKVQTRGIPF
jgi:hypothetical protein